MPVVRAPPARPGIRRTRPEPGPRAVRACPAGGVRRAGERSRGGRRAPAAPPGRHPCRDAAPPGGKKLAVPAATPAHPPARCPTGRGLGAPYRASVPVRQRGIPFTTTRTGHDPDNFVVVYAFWPQKRTQRQNYADLLRWSTSIEVCHRSGGYVWLPDRRSRNWESPTGRGTGRGRRRRRPTRRPGGPPRTARAARSNGVRSPRR